MKTAKCFIAIMLTVFSVISCGGGGGSSTITITDVSGTYSFITDTYTYTCTDGSSGTHTAIADTGIVGQSGHSLTITGANAIAATATVLSDTGTTGTIEDSGHFVTNRTVAVSIVGIENPVTIGVTLDGYFTTTGWSGTATSQYSFTSPYIVSCTYTASFRGDKG